MVTITPIQGAQTTIYCCLEPSLEEKSGAYFSDCKEKRAQRRALVERDQDKLWELSMEFVGLKK